MKKIDAFFEKYWVYLNLLAVAYVAANQFRLWKTWNIGWLVHVVMAVFFFFYGRFWLLSSRKMPPGKERRNQKITGVISFLIVVGCLILWVYSF